MKTLLTCLAVLMLSGCVSFSARDPSPVPLAGPVDLPRFMGDWYVIAHIPTDRDRGSHNAVETYVLREDGRVATTYTNRIGGFEGRARKLTPIMEVLPDSGNALWAVRFGWYWPFPYEYRIAHLEPDYSVSIIARSDLDYLWLFSRRPQMSDAELQRYTQMMAAWGYDVRRLERVPQRWP